MILIWATSPGISKSKNSLTHRDGDAEHIYVRSEKNDTHTQQKNENQMLNEKRGEKIVRLKNDIF